MPSIYDDFPEWECANKGDPFLEEIVAGDDVITDNLDDPAVVLWAERMQMDFELNCLERWLRMELWIH